MRTTYRQHEAKDKVNERQQVNKAERFVSLVTPVVHNTCGVMTENQIMTVQSLWELVIVIFERPL